MATAPVEKVAAKKTPTFKVKKLLTRETLSMKNEGAEIWIKITSLMYVGKEMKNEKVETQADGSKKKRDPAVLCDVIDLMTGVESQIVVASILKDRLTEEYTDNSYVGKSFHIKNLGKKDSAGGQRYNKFLIEEIEVE